MGSLFFSGLPNILKERQLGFHLQFMIGTFCSEMRPETGFAVACRGPPSARSNSDFGEDVHAADLRRHPKFGSFFFHPNYSRLATHPAFLAGGEFGRKNQHQFDVRALFHAGLGVEEDSVGASIAGLRGLIHALSGAHTRGNAGRDSSSRAALGVSLHAGESAHLLYTNARNWTRSSTGAGSSELPSHTLCLYGGQPRAAVATC